MNSPQSSSQTNNSFLSKFYRIYLKIWRVLLSLVLIVAGAGVYFIFFSGTETVKAEWWNDSWLYRQAIPVVNNTSAQTNVYISVTLNTDTASTSMQADCGDFRFTREDGSLLPYYIVSGCRSAANVIHVNFDSFPAGAQTVYFYYGNASAENGFSAADFSSAATSYSIGATQTVETGPGPVGYWSFDEGYGATTHDESGQGNDGTITGAVWKDGSECVSGKCLYFDGTNDFVNTAFSQNLSHFTVGVWVKSPAVPSDAKFGAIVWQNEINNIAWDHPDASFRGAAALNTVPWYSSSFNDLEANTWYYLSASYDGDVFTTYKNGVLINENYDPGGEPLFSDSLFVVGRDTEEDDYFNGFIDEVKIYPYARTADQIKQDYNAGLAGVETPHGASATFGGASDKWLSDGLVGYWKMDESATTSGAVDASGNGNTGTFYGNASTTAGKFGNGGVFDLGGGYIDTGEGSVANSELDLVENFTLFLWLKADSVPSEGQKACMLCKGNNSTLQYGVFLDMNRSIYISQSDYYGSDTISLGQWYNLIVVYGEQGTKPKVYINGEIQEMIGPGINPSHHDNNLMFGAVNPSGTALSRYDGQIDEVRVYNRALSPDEVRKLYEWAPGPVAHWKFDEMSGATAFDSIASSSTAGGNDGTISGAAWGRGKYGGALEFDGNNNNVACGSKNILDNLSQRTICSWVKAGSDAPSWQILVDKSENGLNGWNLYLTSSNQISFYQGFSSGNVNIETDSYLIAGKWQHLCVTYDGEPNTNGLDIYVDGISIAVPADTAGSSIRSNDSGFNLNIGNSSSLAYDYYGLIDDVRIYNYARTQKQILEDMNGDVGTRHGAFLRPVLDLNFDEGRGATAYDSSVHDNDGSLQPGTGGTNTSSSSMWTKSGKIGGAMEFDGTDDYTNISGSRSLYQSGDASISLWFKLDQVFNSSSPGGLIPFSLSDAASTNDLTFYMNNSTGKLSFQTYDSTLRDLYTNKNQWAAGTWFNVIATLEDGGIKKLFINGEEEVTAAVSADRGTTLATVAYIGKSYQGYYFNGLIDEVKVWNYALSAEEVKSVYNQNSSLVVNSETDANNNGTTTTGAATDYCVPGDTAECSAPVLEMKFDELSGTITYDTSGNGNDGSISGANWIRGKIGGGLGFDGSDDIVDVNQSASINNLTDFTWEFYAKPTAAGANDLGIVLEKGSGSTVRKTFYFGLPSGGSPGRVYASVDATTDAYVDSIDNAYSLNEWAHWTVTFNNADYYLHIYKNGKEISYNSQTQGAGTIATDNSYNFGIGATPDTAFYAFAGQLDDIKVFNYARTPAQIAWDYNKGKPVAHWRFDECQGSTIHDESGNGNHGILNLGTSDVIATGTCASSSESFWYNGRTGKYNAGGSFDGGDDHIAISDPGAESIFDFTTDDSITLSAWIKPDSFGAYSAFLAKGDTAGANAANYGLEFSSSANGEVNFYYDGLSTSYHTFTSDKTLFQIGVWGHILVTYTFGEGESIKMYFNGVEESGRWTTSNGDDDPNITDQPIWIGNNFYDEEFDGLIDEVKIFNYALTPAQVKNEFNGGSIRFGG